MIKKAGLSALVICLFLEFLVPFPVQASGRLTVEESSVVVDFPSEIDFYLVAEGDVKITDIRLNYRVDRMEFAQVTSEVYIDFIPATVVEVEWSWDMRKTGGLPPGSSVIYWWTVEDEQENKVETEPAIIQIDDSRYLWQKLTEGKVTLYWYEGDDSFSQELMAVAQQALGRLAEYTGAEIEKPVKIYIYASSQDLQGSMIYPQEWTGGVAFTRYGVIAIGISPNQLGWGSKAIAHELTHLVIHQITINPYGDLPTWLDEGLAMFAEGELRADMAEFLSDAVLKDALISVRSLSSPFSAYAEESLLAYAQSYSIVEFLTGEYGQQKMFSLLNRFKQGSGYDDALNGVYGFDLDGLNDLWRDYVSEGALPVLPVYEEWIPPSLIGLLVGVAVGIALWLSLLAEDWAWNRGY